MKKPRSGRGKWLAGLFLLLTALLVIPAALAQDAFVIQVDKLDMSRLGDNEYVQEHLSAARSTYAFPARWMARSRCGCRLYARIRAAWYWTRITARFRAPSARGIFI